MLQAALTARQTHSGYAVASMSDCVCCTHCWKSLGEGALWKKR